MREILEDNTVEETLVTVDEYVENPYNCPVCASRNIFAGIPEVDTDVIVPVRCEDCEADWTEIFILSSFSNVNLPRKHILPKEEDDEPYTQIPIKGE